MSRLSGDSLPVSRDNDVFPAWPVRCVCTMNKISRVAWPNRAFLTLLFLVTGCQLLPERPVAASTSLASAAPSIPAGGAVIHARLPSVMTPAARTALLQKVLTGSVVVPTASSS